MREVCAWNENHIFVSRWKWLRRKTGGVSTNSFFIWLISSCDFVRFFVWHRNTDTAQNHVDRVRVPDSNYDFGGPGRGSGWRHRSLSNIDLTSQSKHSFTKQTRGYTSGLYDLYSRLEARKDTAEAENLYGNVVNSTGNGEYEDDRGWSPNLN